MKTTIFVIVLLLLMFHGPVVAQEAEAEKKTVGWFNSTDFSLVVTEGNSNTDTIGFKNTLTRKWEKEGQYRLIKELWAFTSNRIAVRFAYEWHDHGSNWFRSYGNENWEFNASGLMQLRIASINDIAINEPERKLLWPIGRRPDDHPGLTELGL
jgi:nuclear transport factor 2 (NTF2) superfamily protein